MLGKRGQGMADTAHLEEMIGRMALGDRKAFVSLYAATSAKLHGIALRVLGDGAEAEDAVQEIYVKLWHNAGRYQVNGLSPMTWMITIARNHAIDRLRARKARAGQGPADLDDIAELADLSPGPEEAAIARSERSRIDACLARLDPDRAEAVRRAYVDGDSYADLAARYGVPLNTIRTWLRRSLLRLRECLS